MSKKEQDAGCAKPTRKCPFEAYLEKCTRLEKENLEVKKKLKKMETCSRECKTELQRFVKKFKEFKNINKDLDTKNKQLLIKNQQMRQRITEVLKQNRPQSEDVERPYAVNPGEAATRRNSRCAPREGKKLNRTNQEISWNETGFTNNRREEAPNSATTGKPDSKRETRPQRSGHKRC